MLREEEEEGKKRGREKEVVWLGYCNERKDWISKMRRRDAGT